MSQEACGYVAEQLQKFLVLIKKELKQEDPEISSEPENQNVSNVEQDLLEIQKCIDKYVKLESTKKATIQTIQKLIKLTREKKACFLCKQAAAEECLEQMDKNFNPDVKQHESRVQEAKRILDEKLHQKLTNACARHQGPENLLEVSEQVINQITSELFNSSKQAKTLDLPQVRQHCS